MTTNAPELNFELVARKGVIYARLALDWLVAQFVIGLFRIIRALPFEPTVAAFGATARVLAPILPRRRVAMDNLRLALPDLSAAEHRAIHRGMWDNLVRSAVEFIHVDSVVHLDPARPDPGRVEVVAHRAFFDLRDGGRPAIVFTAHLANWELMPISAALMGLKVASVYRPPNNRFIARYVLKARSAHAGRLVPTMAGAGYELMAVLERGGIVGQLVDQRFRRGLKVPFFGRLAKTNTFPAKLARQYDCAVYGARVVRLPDSRFRVEMTDRVELARDAGGDISVEAATRQIAEVVEGWVREHPEQWLWLHRRWDD